MTGENASSEHESVSVEPDLLRALIKLDSVYSFANWSRQWRVLQNNFCVMQIIQVVIWSI